MVFVIFSLWRLVDFGISFLAPKYISYLGFFPYGALLSDFRLPSFISSLGNFDGIHYVLIANGGYSQYEQAYFPLYSLLTWLISLLFPLVGSGFKNNILLAGLLVSNVSFLFGLIFFVRYLKQQKIYDTWSSVFLLLFPTSFYFGAVYTEGLFFLLFIASLYFLQKKNYWLAGVFAALSSATRLMGVFLIIPFFFSLYKEGLSFKRFTLHATRFAHLLLSPLLGFAAYAVYLWVTVKDPLFFFHAQPAFGANRSTSLILLPQVYYRYIKIFLTAQWNFQYFMSLVEFVVFTFVFIVLVLDLVKNLKPKIKNYTRIGLNLFSFANILLPTLTGTFSSIPRYALFSLSVFLFLGEIKNTPAKIGVSMLFGVLHVVLLAFFIQGYFVG